MARSTAPPSSCRTGVCGTCTVKLVAGKPEHRDRVLTADQRAAGAFTPCVSRAHSAELVLDLDPATTDDWWTLTERYGPRVGGLFRRRRKIELDAVARAVRGEHAALRVKTHGREPVLLVQRMGAGELAHLFVTVRQVELRAQARVETLALLELGARFARPALEQQSSAVLAQRLRGALRSSGTDTVLSSNYGCALHLQEGARAAGLSLALRLFLLSLEDRKLDLDEFNWRTSDSDF